MRAELTELLEDLQRGDVEAAEVLERFASLPFRDLGFARVDLHRELRQGAPEAVLAEGKTPDQVCQIVTARARVSSRASGASVRTADRTCSSARVTSTLPAPPSSSAVTI